MLIQLKTKAPDGSERTRRAKPDVTIAEGVEIAELAHDGEIGHDVPRASPARKEDLLHIGSI